MTQTDKDKIIRGLADHAVKVRQQLIDLDTLALMCCEKHNKVFVEAAKAGRVFLAALTTTIESVSQFHVGCTPEPAREPKTEESHGSNQSNH